MKSHCCIYCSCAGTLSREHYLPKSLGRFVGFETLKDRVCGSCNAKLGKFEDQFKNSSPVALMRIITGAGVPEVERAKQFYAGSHGTSPIKMPRRSPSGTYDVLYEVIAGTSRCEIMRQICVIRPNGEYESIPVPLSLNSGDDIQRFIKSNTLDGSRIHSAFYVPEERQLMEALLNAIAPNHRRREVPIAWESETMKPTIAVEYSDFFNRAIAKIGFHYALKFFPELRGDESEFEEIRDFVMNGGSTKGTVMRRTTPFLEPWKKGLTSSRHCHVLLADRRDNLLKTQCLFYTGPRGDRLGYEVILGQNPFSIVVEPEIVCHAYIYFADGAKNGYDGEIERLRCTTSPSSS